MALRHDRDHLCPRRLNNDHSGFDPHAAEWINLRWRSRDERWRSRICAGLQRVGRNPLTDTMIVIAPAGIQMVRVSPGRGPPERSVFDGGQTNRERSQAVIRQTGFVIDQCTS